VARYHMVPVSMTLSDPWPEFKVEVFSISDMSKTVQDRAIVTIEHRKSYNDLSNGVISNDLE